MDKVDMIDAYLDFARPLYAGKDAAHDFRHTERIISRLGALAEGLEPPPCSYKLNFLACFHGLGPRVDSDPDLRAKIIAFLRDLGWKQHDIDASLSSLNTHLSAPRTSEELIVHDANYFEVTGAFGIAKAFMAGGARGQTYERTVEIFDANLRRLTFRTPSGKRCYESRKAYAEAYLAMLRDDLNFQLEFIPSAQDRSEFKRQQTAIVPPQTPTSSPRKRGPILGIESGDDWLPLAPE